MGKVNIVILSCLIGKNPVVILICFAKNLYLNEKSEIIYLKTVANPTLIHN